MGPQECIPFEGSREKFVSLPFLLPANTCIPVLMAYFYLQSQQLNSFFPLWSLLPPWHLFSHCTTSFFEGASWRLGPSWVIQENLCKIFLPCKVTKSQVSGTGHEFGDRSGIIIHPTASSKDKLPPAITFLYSLSLLCSVLPSLALYSNHIYLKTDGCTHKHRYPYSTYPYFAPYCL